MADTGRPPTPLRKGCWTCVVRHKRCDNTFPSCQLCTRLGVTCAGYDEEKPDWFDAGDKLAKYKEELKDVIKDNRRHRKAGSISRPTSPASVQMEWANMWTPTPEQHNMNAFGVLHPVTYTMASSPPLVSHHPEAFIGHSAGFIPTPQPEPTPVGHMQPALRWDSASPNSFQTIVQGSSDNEAFVMDYFDRLVPSMTPLLCAPPARTEKGALLKMVNNLHIFRNIVIGITRQTLNLPHDNMNTYFPSLHELTHLFEGPEASQDSEQLNMLQPPLKGEQQVLTLDHYVYALRLGVTRDDANPMFLASLARLAVNNLKSLNSIVWSFDQCRCGQVFASRLVRSLVLASIFCSRADPCIDQLQACIDDILGQISTEMYKVSGCSTKSLRSIQKISNLMTWKSQQRDNGSLSIMELSERARDIGEDIAAEQQRINSALDSLAGVSIASCVTYSRSAKAQGISCGISDHAGTPASNCSWHTNFAMTTALLYTNATEMLLHTVMSGVNPKLPEVANAVASNGKALQYLASINAPIAMEITWPLCMTALLCDRTTQEGQNLCNWIVTMLEEWSAMYTRFTVVLATIKKWWTYQDTHHTQNEGIQTFMLQDQFIPMFLFV